MLLDLSHHFLLPILFVTGVAAGTIDAIAGGGGLISLPVLLSVGIPPHLALGTNKFQGTFGTLISTWSYHRQGWISIRGVAIGLICGFIGASAGAVVGQIISGAVLGKLIPVLLIFILAYMLFVPKRLSHDSKPKLKEAYFYLLFGLLLGFYDGFFGPGAGTFWVFAMIFFLGYSLTKATAYTKILNLNTNIASVLCFGIGGNIDYRIALCMAAGQLIGGKLGVHLALKKGADFIRSVFVLVVCATIMTLVYKNFSGVEGGIVKIILAMSVFSSLIGVYFWNKRKERQINTQN